MHPSESATGYGIFTSAIPILPTTDVGQAITFYGHLGFQTRYHDTAYAIFTRDSIELHVWLCLDPDISGNSACRIRIRGIEALYQQLHAKGLLEPLAAVTQKPWGTHEFEVFSPERVIITFVEQRNESNEQDEGENP